MSYIWDVTRVTTDKLADELNDIAWEIHQIQYVGGRDWVIISRQADQEKPLYKGTATHNGSYWEIEIPSMGPHDESIKTTISRHVDIEEAAKEAISTVNGWAPEEFDVDIKVF